MPTMTKAAPEISSATPWTLLPSGFGFVEMGSSEEAQAAISALNGRDVDGSQLTVNLAKPHGTAGVGS